MHITFIYQLTSYNIYRFCIFLLIFRIFIIVLYIDLRIMILIF